MRVGLALPHYDFSLLGDAAEGRPLGFEAIVEVARRAEGLGFDSLWVSDHLSLSIEKYGGGSREWFAYEPLTLLAALACHVRGPRLGTLVLCEALRPAGVAAKALTTLDHLCDGRLDLGVGAGWYEPDYQAIGLDLPPPAQRLARLEEALIVLDALLPGGPATVDGRFHRVRGAVNRPPTRQTPRPPLFVGGKGDRLLGLVARRADGWNTCWVWTPAAYRERVAALERACETAGRDPASVRRSLGLYTLVGEDHADLERRFERMRRLAPGGMLRDTTLAEWREGRLVGTVEEVAEQVTGWEAAGVAEIICGVGPLPFSLGALDDLEPVAAGLLSPGGG
ncbi:MAG: LLM class flavin-dependent oxidoreductase [Acidimicrobiia bacterium]